MCRMPIWLLAHCLVFTANLEPAIAGIDANDESLQRYKESLGLGGGKDLSDPRDPRVCIILSLTMESPGRDPVTIDLKEAGSEKTLKDKPFKIKEGAKFTMVASFKVQHEILSGLHYVQAVKRKGIRVSKDSEMIVSFGPPSPSSNTSHRVLLTSTADYDYRAATLPTPTSSPSTPRSVRLTWYAHREGRFTATDDSAVNEEEAPSGMLARGHYNAVSSFVDDDKKKHLEFEWSFDIAKDW